jgi:multiple sugar transport system permease protein
MAATTTTARPAPVAEVRVGADRNKVLRRVFTYVLLVLIALVFLIPLAWMISTSLKPKSQWFSAQIYWIPKTITLENYQSLVNNPATPIVRWFGNSLMVGALVTVLILVIDSLAAYAYARMEFKGRGVLFALLLATLFLPGMMFLVPNFLTIFALHLLNTYAGVILPGLAGVFGVFFLRQFFETIPKELEEAAVLDGANAFQTFWRVALPLARPALATLAVITFLASWNDFLWPLLILQQPDLMTLPPGLATLQGAYTSEYGQMMAGAMVAAVPVLILYIGLQRFIVQSVATTGLK